MLTVLIHVLLQAGAGAASPKPQSPATYNPFGQSDQAQKQFKAVQAAKKRASAAAEPPKNPFQAADVGTIIPEAVASMDPPTTPSTPKNPFAAVADATEPSTPVEDPPRQDSTPKNPFAAAGGNDEAQISADSNDVPQNPFDNPPAEALNPFDPVAPSAGDDTAPEDSSTAVDQPSMPDTMDSTAAADTGPPEEPQSPAASEPVKDASAASGDGPTSVMKGMLMKAAKSKYNKRWAARAHACAQ